jgi:hypothetical protein
LVLAIALALWHSYDGVEARLAPSLTVGLLPRKHRQGGRNYRTNRVPARQSSTREELSRVSADLSTVAISNWQSPTITLMESPSDDVLTSLPQLDQSATELKTFLPGTIK